MAETITPGRDDITSRGRGDVPYCPQAGWQLGAANKSSRTPQRWRQRAGHTAFVDEWSDVGSGSDIARIERSRSDRTSSDGRTACTTCPACPACNHAHRHSRLVLARSPSRDLTRHGCRVRAYMDVLAACPAMVGGQGPCSKPTDHPLCLAACPATLGRQGPRRQATDQPLCLAACPATLGRQGPRRQATDQPLCLAACPAMVAGQGPRRQAADHPLCTRRIPVRSPIKTDASYTKTDTSYNAGDAHLVVGVVALLATLRPWQPT
ncbi:hypothetical protein NCPPB1935_07600 [Xanthomonas campestris pv. nigromaculans]|nr:hypothetical protein NCPPB1935_07600 [Xanthomonas campestris pv. nigromaculans]